MRWRLLACGGWGAEGGSRSGRQTEEAPHRLEPHTCEHVVRACRCEHVGAGMYVRGCMCGDVCAGMYVRGYRCEHVGTRSGCEDLGASMRVRACGCKQQDVRAQGRARTSKLPKRKKAGLMLASSSHLRTN